MAKQTFTTGQVLTAAQMTSLQQTAMLGGAASAKIASYVLVAADAGDAITMSNAGATTITANTGLFAAGDIVTIINLGAGVCTVTAGTATVNTSGSLVLAQYQGGVLYFTSTSAAIFFQFATPESGDITGITATSPLTGGGTSGAVTVGIQDALTTQKGAVQLSDSTSTTSSILAATPTAVKAAYDLADGAIAKSTVTTAGDIIYRNATVPVRLGIGTAGQVLKVNSGATAPEWGAAAAGFVGCSITRTNTSSAITNGVNYMVPFTAENYDTDAFHDNSTNNSRITIPTGKGGKYYVSTMYNNALGAIGSYAIIRIYLNGSQIAQGFREGFILNSDATCGNASAVLTLSAGDYIEMGYQQGNTETVNMWFVMSATYLGA
jgi:hypothetical protein